MILEVNFRQDSFWLLNCITIEYKHWFNITLDKTLSVNTGVPSSGTISFLIYMEQRIMPLTKLQFKPE